MTQAPQYKPEEKIIKENNSYGEWFKKNKFLAGLITITLALIIVSGSLVFAGGNVEFPWSNEDAVKIDKEELSDQKMNPNELKENGLSDDNLNNEAESEDKKDEISEQVLNIKTENRDNADITVTNNNKKIYANQYFPKLEIVYDSSWKLETNTNSENIYRGLLNRDIILKKGDSIINITLTPSVATGCGPGQDLVNTKKIRDGLYTYKQDSKNYYTKKEVVDRSCKLENIFPIKSNIKAVDIDDYAEINAVTDTELTVEYWAFVNSSIDDESTLIEVEAILSQSTIN